MQLRGISMAQASKRRTASSIDRGGAAAPKGNYTVPALDKAFDVIELLASTPGGATMNEIATRLGRSMGELFRTVIVMEHRGLLQKAPETDRYTVAYRFLDLALRATPAQDLTRAAEPAMQLLVSQISQSCHLVVPNGGEGLVVYRQENPGMRGFMVRVGASVDLVRSCSGHVILAFSDDQQRERLMHLAERLTRTRLNQTKVESLLVGVRERGFERCASPITHGVTDISYPIFGFYGNLMAALTVPFLELLDGSQKVGIDEARKYLENAALSISATLGHHESLKKKARRKRA
jgi:DNA-binding IclR family transcriptional regulator